MALSIIFFAFFCCLYGSSFGNGHAKQTCPTGYYCPNGGACVCRCPRSDRCTQDQNCTGLDECYKQPNGSYLIRIGHTTISGLGIHNLNIEHRFLIYRGFAYEFGANYSTQVLDIIDPEYKYAGGKHLNPKGIRDDGVSRCTYEEAMLFVNRWNKRYNLVTNNCLHFTGAMSKYLNNLCNQQVAVNMITLQEQIDEMLSNYMCEQV